MYRFWSALVQPLLRDLDPRVLVEVGAARGQNTRNLVAFADGRDVAVHAIDPAPAFDPDALRPAAPARFVFHRATSLEALPRAGAGDVVLLDGDHNWYTVYHELELLDRLAAEARVPFPVVILHDVGWPYGRRDLYYDARTVPEEARQPCARGGLSPGRSELQGSRGLNAFLVHAAHEGGPRNGVRTAIDDFLAARSGELTAVFAQAVHGIGVLLPAERVPPGGVARDLVDAPEATLARLGVYDLAEEHRIRAQIALFETQRELARAQRRLADLEG